jgi:hypothetical protein
MRIKKEVIVLAVVIIGLSLYLVFRQTDRTYYELPVLSQVEANAVDALEIEKSGKPLRLAKSGDRWVVGDKAYPADADAVAAMRKVIASLTVTDLVAESKAYARYQLAGPDRIRVRAYTGNTPVREFDVGKAAATYQHTFVKLPENPNVYHAQGNFRKTFDVSLAELRDKTVLAFKTDAIFGIKIVGAEQTLEIERGEAQPPEKSADQKAPPPGETASKTVWKTKAGKSLDGGTVDGLLSYLSGLRCDDYLTGREKGDLSGPIYTLTLETESNPITLAVFPKEKSDDKRHPAVSSENDYPFYLTEDRVEHIKSTMGKLGQKDKADKTDEGGKN